MSIARTITFGLALALLTGCVMPANLLTDAGDGLPAGLYYVDQQDGKLFALALQREEWVTVEVAASDWFDGAGMYALDAEGGWRLDPDATASLHDETDQLTDERPAPPAG